MNVQNMPSIYAPKLTSIMVVD